MKKILRDKLFLITVGIAIFVLGFLIIFYIKSLWGKNIGEEWTDFIIASLFYLIILFGVTLTMKDFKRVKKMRLLIYLGVTYVLTVSSAYIVFVFEIFPMPKHHRVYIIAMIILGTVTIGSLQYFVKKMKFFRNNTQKQKAEWSQ